jgi:putative transposase
MDEIAHTLACLSSVIDSTKLRQLTIISAAMLCMTGRITMLSISRWAGSGGSYRTIQRFFTTSIAWDKLHWAMVKKKIKKASVILLAGDATTVTKSGKHTHGVGKFFSSIYSKVVGGIAFQCISIIDVDTRKSFPIMAEQILPKVKEEAQDTKPKPKRGVGRPKGSKNKNKADVKLNAEMAQLKIMLANVKALISDVVKPVYFLYDGAFGNNAAAQLVIQSGLQLVSKLKNNSALYLPYNGIYSGKGAPRKYGNRIDFREIPESFLMNESTEDNILTRYFQLQVLSKSFACPLNIVVIYKKNNLTDKVAHVILFSTDINLSWDKIVDYYSLRFQIEFNFRDAKQFWGLEDFMVVKDVCVTNAANLSFHMVNLSQSLLPASNAISLNDLKAHYRGLKYVDEVFKLLPKNSEIIKNDELIERVTALGRIHELKKCA